MSDYLGNENLMSRISELQKRLEILERTSRVATLTGINGVATDTIATAESRSSTAWGDLATVGPEVTVDVGPSGQLLVILFCQAYYTALGAAGCMGFELSGANTEAALDNNQLQILSSVYLPGGRVCVVTDLDEGLTTVTAQYKTDSGGLGDRNITYKNRQITVFPL
jgi:hypothetical protein